MRTSHLRGCRDLARQTARNRIEDAVWDDEPAVWARLGVDKLAAIVDPSSGGGGTPSRRSRRARVPAMAARSASGVGDDDYATASPGAAARIFERGPEPTQSHVRIVLRLADK
jgi:hypothetical protein